MTGPEAPRKDRGSNRGHSRNRARRGHCRSPRRQQVLHLHRPSPIRGDTPSRRHPIRAATARSPRWQGTAFLIANPFAAGVAEATVASDDVPATNTIVATSFVKRLAILLSPGGVALRRTILWPDGGSMRDPLRRGSIEAANFVRP